MIVDWIVALLLVASGIWTLLAAIGVARMPDLFTRMHPATKASSIGLGCALAAVAIHFRDVGVSTRAFLAILFVFLTMPVAAHRIARAAYSLGEEHWGSGGREDSRADGPDRNPES